MIITDQAPSTKVAMAKIMKVFKLNPNCHCTSKYLNNLIEQDHRHIKMRKTTYQSVNTQKIQSKGLNVFTDYIKRTAGLFISMDFLHAKKVITCKRVKRIPAC